jgi:hypothetical protein
MVDLQQHGLDSLEAGLLNFDTYPEQFDFGSATDDPTSRDGQAHGTIPSDMHEVFAFDPELFGTDGLTVGLNSVSLATPVQSDPFGGHQDFPNLDSPQQPLQSQLHHTPGWDFRPSPQGSLTMNHINPQRSLPRRRSRYFHTDRRRGSRPQAIPQYPGHDDTALDPMQRWRDSPPEAEGASLAAIADALKDALPSMGSASSSDASRRRNSRRAAYSTSGGTSVSSMSTGSSRSVASHHKSTSSLRRGRVTKAAGSRGRKAMGNSDQERRPFQCTFCCDSFRTKYDWSRHETSLHLSLEKWVCSPHGGAVISQATGRNHCAYCNMLDPAPAHLETHGHSLCHSGDETHVFSRKDHLVQHLRLVHRLDTLPIISDWKVEAPPMVSRCGFCNTTMHTWRQRADHLAAHFNEGKTMDDWQGGHGFEPSIEALVMNALPPYALGTERRSFVPFSATCSDSRDHIMQMRKFYEDRQSGEDDIQGAPGLGPSSADQMPVGAGAEEDRSMVSHTSMTWITRGMARFAQRQMRLGVIPTDAMFQNEARRLIYGSEDGWEQTIADNGEWLANFRTQIVEKDPS